MRQLTHFVIGAAVVFLLVAGVFGQGGAGNGAQQTASKFIPAGMVSAHTAVKGRFADSVSNDPAGNIVVLYKKESDGRSYEGLVLAPQGPATYNRHQLPSPESAWSMMEPIAIFFANADGDAENELFIIDECYTGIGPDGAKAFYRTRVYDWNGIAFSHLDAVSEKIGNSRTVAAARAKLRQFSKVLGSTKTEMAEAVDFAAHNQTIDKAATAGEAWVKDPARIIARTFGGFSEMRSKTVEFLSQSPDGSDTLSVTVTNDGYMDDSIRGERFRLELKLDDQGTWKFTSANKSWRCQTGRGNQEYSIVRCT